MEVLAVFDEKNYDDTTKVYEKYNVIAYDSNA